MEKVKITKEQEAALVFYKAGHDFSDFVLGKVNFEGRSRVLEHFTDIEFSLLLHNWYEVEQPFKVGDWVYDKGLEEYRKIGNGNYIFGKYNTVSVRVVWNEPDEFEKVTEPWKIMLLELGREKPEFHKNDVIVTESEVYEAEYLTDEEIIVLFEKDLVRAFHAAEHRIEVKGHDS